MMDRKAGVLHRAGHWAGAPAGHVALDYEGRFLRRRRLETVAGDGLLVDLPETISVDHGDAFETADGAMIEVQAAPEALLRVSGDLVRLAWHIGNRHTPCQIADDHLLIRDDHVLKAMLEQLGADVRPFEAPFRPEGGAYGHGRTMGHSHGHDHDHSHDHHHDHDHGHGHSHDHGHSKMNSKTGKSGHGYSDLNDQRDTHGHSH